MDINFGTVKEIVTGKSEVDHLYVVDKNKIVRNPSRGHLITKREVKEYKIVFEKRVIVTVDDYQTLSYGF